MEMTEVTCPEVSVIVPLYNMADYVEAAIESALQQTGVSLEVIVVDDASTDDSVTKVQGLRDPRVRLERLPQNAGVAAARNRGLQLASGRWIQFLDPDDWLLPDKLRRQLMVADRAGVIAGRWREQPEAGGRQQRLRPEFDFAADAFEQIVRGNPFPIHAMLVRRDLALAVGGFDGGVHHEDWDFWLKLAACGARFAYVAGAEVIYRIRDMSRSGGMRDRLLHDLGYLDSLADGRLPVSATLLADARRRRYYQLALLALRRDESAEAAQWQTKCLPLGPAERLEFGLARLPFTGWLAGRVPGPRKMQRLLRGWFSGW